jgi:hypothetical protein
MDAAKLATPKRDEAYAYRMGQDCARNGPNLTNCHFSIFDTPEMAAAWERGRDGLPWRLNREPMVEYRDGAWWIVEHLPGVEVNLPSLAPNQCVAWGDGETYHRLLTRTDAKSEAAALALARATPTESED